LEVVKYQVPSRIGNDYSGFCFFSQAFENLKGLEKKTVVFDFSKTTWFEANLVAVFSSLVEMLKERGCLVAAKSVSKKIKHIFKKNGFYDFYKLGAEEDIYDSTIPFHIFDVNDGEGFTEYLNDIVIPKIKLPLSKDQTRYFKKCLQEVFENASIHAGSERVFTCGQYYHSRQKVAFTIVDLGRTIGENVRRKVSELDDCASIQWATEFGNTTKIAQDGGIGLHFLKEYLHNNGILQIVSGNGYWEQNLDKINNVSMDHLFDGTIVNIISDLAGAIDNTVGEIEF
jgi:hypothetical protein